jgi:hypothetical protein
MADLAVSLGPPPAWICWNHGGPGVWPVADDRPDDLNATKEPAWLTSLARRIQAKLASSPGIPPIVGHCDWESQNMRWIGRELLVVHDWDSCVSLPEPYIARAASVMFPTAGGTLDAASIEESESFLRSYEEARGRTFTSLERELCWAAGLWPMTYNAKKESLDQAGGPVASRLASQATERLGRAGIAAAGNALQA